jgi:hypothetical protein
VPSSWQRPAVPIEGPDPVRDHRDFWLQEMSESEQGRTLRWVALEIVYLAQHAQRERERRLSATGRTLWLPKEDAAGEARAQAHLHVLDLLRDLYRRLREG